MNDKNQAKFHSEKPMMLECKINETEEGYQSSCPTCPWTSGIKESQYLAKLSFYKHLEFIGKLL